MKTRRSKKFYDLTEKHKRRDRSRKTPTWMLRMCDAGFRRMHNKLTKAKERQAMRLIELGRNAEFPRIRKTVLWYYW